jgi:hypothetical protein
MFNFLKNLFNKPKVEFYPIIPQLIDTFPPDNGKKDVANFFKKIKPVKYHPDKDYSTELSIKNCPAVVEYYKYGYVIRLWQDIVIRTTPDGESYEWNSATNTNVFLSKHFEQNTNFSKEVFHFPKDMYSPWFPRKDTLKYILQIPTRWCIKLPKGYAAMFLPVWYDNEDRFTVIPGMLTSGTVEEVNVFIQWNKLGTEEVIKAGTPLVKIVPFKIEKDNVEIRQITEQDAYTFRKFNLLKGNHF